MELAAEKVAQVILYAHELGRARPELQAFIEMLNDDEAAELVAIMWVGRGSFEPEEFEDAIMLARAERVVPTPEYLMGTPHFGDHLEAGMDALGIECRALEAALL
jgi:hypothetical protein